MVTSYEDYLSDLWSEKVEKNLTWSCLASQSPVKMQFKGKLHLKLYLGFSTICSKSEQSNFFLNPPAA